LSSPKINVAAGQAVLDTVEENAFRGGRGGAGGAGRGRGRGGGGGGDGSGGGGSGGEDDDSLYEVGRCRSVHVVSA